MNSDTYYLDGCGNGCQSGGFPEIALHVPALQFIAGLLVGLILVRTIMYRRLTPRIYLLLSIFIVLIVWQYGWWGLEERLVVYLSEFFASNQFALGAVVGGVLAVPLGRHS